MLFPPIEEKLAWIREAAAPRFEHLEFEHLEFEHLEFEHLEFGQLENFPPVFAQLNGK